MSNRRELAKATKQSKESKPVAKPRDIDYNSIMGYRDDSPFRNKSSININTPTGTIDMSNTGIALMANGRYLPPYSGIHKFNTNQVTETPLSQAKKGGGLKRKKEIQQPGQWAGVTPELVQPGKEVFELPNTPSVPAEFQTMACPIFHKYDPNIGECVPFTEEEKAAYSLQYMKDWVQSPMHEQMLRASIEKDAPAGNIDNYVKNITDLRLRATDPNISFLPTGKDTPIGEADPYNLYTSKYTNGKEVYDPLFNSENEQDILNEKKLDTPLYLQSGVNNLNFYKSNTPNNKDLKSQAIFYTKDLPGEHAYVYPHEFSHLQDMGGGLIPVSDYKTMESGVLPSTISYNKIKEISKKYNIDSDISKNDPETYKKYLEEISDVYKKEYPKYRKYDADKKLYETDYNKYKVQRNEGDIINSPSDNSMPYEEFTQKHLANKFFRDIDLRKDYIGLDTEARARLNAIRMYGKASGIYDPYTEKLTPEKYNQIQNLFNEQNPNASDANQLRQLQEVYKDEDILNMLNTISKNDTKENDTEVYTAKRGGALKSKKYSRSLSATNKFFREHAFFEKPKKLSKKRIYDPNARYYQDGGKLPEDYQSFLDYSATAPENRQPSENYYYMSPDEYDHYGMWEALGKPQNFEQALEMNPDWQQDEEGYYHGYSVNPYTGVFLKAGAPGLEEGDTKWMEIKDHYLSPRANTSTPVYDPELQRFKYIPKEENGGLTQYAPGGDWPPRWLAKNNSNIYFNPVYTNTFTGATNSLEAFNNPDKFPIYKVDPSAVVGIEGGLGKRDLRDLTPRGWSYNAYAGLPYSGIKDKNYIPSLGVKFDYENSPQDTIFRPHAEIAADYGTGTGFNITGTGGLRFPLRRGSDRLKPGYGGGHIDIYGGGKAGLGKDNASAGVVYGARIHGKYQPRWLDKISRGSYFYGDAGIQFDPVKGKQSQSSDLYELPTLQDEQGNPISTHIYSKAPGVKWGLTPYANFGIKKDIDRINSDKKNKKIQAIEDKEKILERERKITPNTQGTVPFTYSRDQQKNGGLILDLSEDEIKKYVDGGYVIEEIDDPSIPTLNQMDKGGSNPCPPGQYWDGKKCIDTITTVDHIPYRDKTGKPLKVLPKSGTIYVTDPNDPKLLEYKKRQELYEMSKKQYSKILKDIDENISITLEDIKENQALLKQPGLTPKERASIQSVLNSDNAYLTKYKNEKALLYDDWLMKSASKLNRNNIGTFAQYNTYDQKKIYNKGVKEYKIYPDYTTPGSESSDRALLYSKPSLKYVFADPKNYTWNQPKVVETPPIIKEEPLPVLQPLKPTLIPTNNATELQSIIPLLNKDINLNNLELNTKKDNLPAFNYIDPTHDLEYIRLKKGTRPIAKWNPYSAALRMFTGYEGNPFGAVAKEGSSKKELLTEIQNAKEEGRPINFEGIPIGSKSDLKQRRLYKKALEDYYKEENKKLNTYTEGGESNYQLGDEVDEATMEYLKSLGYTFEEI